MLPDLGVKLEELGREVSLLDFSTEQVKRLQELVAEVNALCLQQKRKLAS